MVMGMIDDLLGCWCFGYAPQRIYMKICVMNLALIYRFHALVPLVVGTAKSCMPLDLIEKRPSRCFVESISKVVDIDVGECHRTLDRWGLCGPDRPRGGDATPCTPGASL